MGDSLGMEASLAQDLKVFRKQFRKDHGRDPSRKDMNKHPAIAATYDEWLALKSSQSRASGSGSSVSVKRKAAADPPRHASARSSKGEGSSTLMAPPPTTPSKKKPRQRVPSNNNELFKTPTKRNGKAATQSPGAASVHDSAGSIVDVPSSPKEVPASPSLSRKQKPNTRTVVYESPTKIRDLLSSFSSIHRTPTKATGKDLNGEVVGKLKNGVVPAYTPRTKARKRLRGEVVITPEKVKRHGDDVEPASVSSRPAVQPPQKRRRGMATSTLQDYGIVSIAGPRSKLDAGSNGLGKGTGKIVQFAAQGDEADRSEEEEDDHGDDDEMLGPSPSLNRVVDRPVRAYQPLFGVEAHETLADEAEEKDTVNLAESKKPITKQTSKAELEDEDRDIVIVPYQRYRKSDVLKHAAADSDEEGLHYYNAISAVAANEGETDHPSTPPRDSSPPRQETPSLLDSLSLHSPQLKRARNMQRIKAEKSVRQLIGADESLAILDEWVENEGGLKSEGQHTGTRKESAPKSNKVGPAIKGGRVMKSAKDFKPVLSNGKAEESKEKAQKGKQKSLVFSNMREQLGSDQESDVEGIDSDSDEWASEVDSAEYGLGDGYMSDQD